MKKWEFVYEHLPRLYIEWMSAPNQFRSITSKVNFDISSKVKKDKLHNYDFEISSFFLVL